MNKPVPGTFNDHAVLVEPLPPMVRKQRRLEKKIAAIGTAIEDEKALRKEIDALLAKAGLERNDLVTCLGYDVIRRGQAGRSSIDPEILEALLLEAGVDGEIVDDVIKKSTKTGEPAAWAEVKPSKGAKVRR